LFCLMMVSVLKGWESSASCVVGSCPKSGFLIFIRFLVLRYERFSVGCFRQLRFPAYLLECFLFYVGIWLLGWVLAIVSTCRTIEAIKVWFRLQNFFRNFIDYTLRINRIYKFDTVILIGVEILGLIRVLILVHGKR